MEWRATYIHSLLHRINVEEQDCRLVALDTTVTRIEALDKWQHEIDDQTRKYDMLKRCTIFNVPRDGGGFVTMVRCCQDYSMHTYDD